jgi:hypothetical protein
MVRGKGGSGFAGAISGPFGGSLVIVMSVVALLACLIAYTIVIGQIDTSYTSAASYTEQKGLAESFGMLPMIFFIGFMALGMGGIVGGTIMNVRQTQSGSWAGILSGILGAVSIVIILVLNDLIQAQLHTAYTTTNATTNIAHFSGVLGIMGIWGMVILWSLVGSSLTQVGFAGVGTYKKMTGKA